MNRDYNLAYAVPADLMHSPALSEKSQLLKTIIGGLEVGKLYY